MIRIAAIRFEYANHVVLLVTDATAPGQIIPTPARHRCIASSVRSLLIWRLGNAEIIHLINFFGNAQPGTMAEFGGWVPHTRVPAPPLQNNTWVILWLCNRLDPSSNRCCVALRARESSANSSVSAK